MTRYQQASDYILTRMKTELSPKLYYHNIPHILDVLQAAEAIASSENVNAHDLELLRVAVLFHDSGFIVGRENHEQTGCVFAREFLPEIGYAADEINQICSLILATKVPHLPKNKLEEIICDADLDYLGRDDFFTIGNKIFREFLEYGLVSDEHQWNQMQVNFLSTHNYFTETSKNLRKAKKELHLEEVKQLLKRVVGKI